MADDAFAVERLVALYDQAEDGRQDLVHYKRMVTELGASTVLDIGCGTGTLACQLAESGFAITGVDPAQASLEVAQRKPGADRVNWILGNATTAADQLGTAVFDLVVMTGNVAQVFLGDDWAETLRAIQLLLRPGGHFVFETRDPAFRGWEEWTKEQSLTVVNSPTEGPVETSVELTQVALPFVSFRWTYRFETDGAELYSDSTLRFRDRPEVEASLLLAGFNVVDVRDAPDRPNKEFVFIAAKPTSTAAKEFYSTTGRWWGDAEAVVDETDHLRAAIAAAHTHPRASVLELGCGYGSTAQATAALGLDVTGIDFSDRIDRADPTLGTFIKADFMSHVFDRRFDLVTYWDGFGLGSMADHLALLDRIADDLLSPAGVAVIEVYDPTGFSRDHGLVDHRAARPADGYPCSLDHRRLFDSQTKRAIDVWQEHGSDRLWHQTLQCYSPEDFTKLVDQSRLRVDAVLDDLRSDWSYLVVLRPT